MLREIAALAARLAADALGARLAAEAAASSDVLAAEGLTLSLVPPPSAVEVAAVVASLVALLSPDRAGGVADRLDAAGAPYTAQLVRLRAAR